MKRDDISDYFGTIWAFTSSYPNLATVQNRLFLTGNSYIGFTNQVDTFSINYPKFMNNNITAREWRLVTVVFDTASIDIYVNGTKISKTFASTAGTNEAAFDYKKVMDMVTAAKFFTLGMGNGIASATADYDDLLIYDRPLTPDDVKLLYSMERRVTDFTAGYVTGIEKINSGKNLKLHYDTIYYDIAGRKILNPTRPGLYFIWSENND